MEEGKPAKGKWQLVGKGDLGPKLEKDTKLYDYLALGATDELWEFTLQCFHVCGQLLVLFTQDGGFLGKTHCVQFETCQV